MRRNVKVEVYNDDPSGCRGYTLYDVSRSGDQAILIARDVDDGQIEQMLGQRFAAFKRGDWRFTVPWTDALAELFHYLPR